jgi:hypothetical protein
MSTDRLDAQVEVKVPAQNGRKAYSYYRNVGIAKKGAAGIGAALTLGGLGAAAIAMRKKPEESKALRTPVEVPAPVVAPQSTASRVGEFAKKAAIRTGETVATLAGSIAVNKAVSFAVKKAVSKITEKPEESGEARRARYAAEDAAEEEAYEQRKAAKKNKTTEREPLKLTDFEDAPRMSGDKTDESIRQAVIKGNRPAPPDRLPSPKPKVQVGGALVPVNKPEAATPPPLTRLPYNPPAPKVSTGGLTVTAGESGENSGSAIAKPQKTLLTKVSGSAGAALGRLVRKGREGWERDRQAGGISSLPDKEYDVNQLAYKAGQKTRSVAKSAAYKAGQGTRSAAESVANFAQSFYSTFVENKANDVQAEEVKEPSKVQRKLGGITIKALPQGGKRKLGRPKTKFGPKDFIKPEDKQVRNNSVYMRIDSLVEQIREDAKCGSGSKSCGKVCIPQEKNCLGETAKAFGGGAVQSLAGPIGSGTYRALRKRGHGRGMSIGGAIAANTVATLTPAAGVLALGAMAAKKEEDEANRKKAKK